MKILVNTVPPISEGTTFYMTNAASFFEVKDKLIDSGFEIIDNIDNYSIYIISVSHEHNIK